MRTHSGERPYRCHISGCNKAYTQLCNLQMHSRTHQIEKNFKCRSCYKCFTDEESLMVHIPKHLETKHRRTSICPYCGKSYMQARYLTMHLRKHETELKRIQQMTEQIKAVASPSKFQGHDSDFDRFQQENTEQMASNQQDRQLATPTIKNGLQMPYCGLPNGMFSAYHPFDVSAIFSSDHSHANSFDASNTNRLWNFEAGQSFAVGQGYLQ